MRITGLHHVQLAMPPGGEEEARDFYAGVLSIPEVGKPPVLAGRGGCWFRNEAVELHVGVEEPFVPARKAHPAFVVEDLDRLERDLRETGREVVWDTELPGHRRFYGTDPFGNRLEFLEAR